MCDKMEGENGKRNKIAAIRTYSLLNIQKLLGKTLLGGLFVEQKGKISWGHTKCPPVNVKYSSSFPNNGFASTVGSIR